MSDTNSVPAQPSTNGPVDTKAAKRSSALLWFLLVVAPLILIAVGISLLALNLRKAGPDFAIRYVFGERKPEALTQGRNPAVDFATDLHHVICLDWLVILGYFLVLVTCAVVFIFTMNTFSDAGRKLSYAILGSAVVATAMDITENALVLWSTNPPFLLEWLPERFWVVAPAALATVKWCALVVAMCASSRSDTDGLATGLRQPSRQETSQRR